MGLRARTVKIGMLAVAIAATAAVTASPAGAVFHSFKGDRGTTCQIEVGAFASDSLGALSGPPHVGYSAVPTCQYPKAKGSGPAKGGRKKACRKPKAAGKRGKKRCGKRKKRAGARAAVDLAVLVDLLAAKLELLGPLGNVTSVGQQTMTAPVVGYSCTIGVGTACGDAGRLVPAIPGASYTPEFRVRVEPPAGETWVSRPAGCSSAPVPVCVLGTGAVVPEL